MKQLLLLTTLILSLIINGVIGQTTVCYDFSAGGASTSGNLDANISFTSQRNNSSTNPAIFSNQLRLYQNATKGGSIIINALNGVTITDVVVSASGTTGPSGYEEDGVFGSNFASSTTYTMSGLAATTDVEFYQRDASSGNRIYIDQFCVTYTTGSTDTESEFTSSSVTVAENAGTTNLPLTIVNPAPGATTTTTIELTSGNAAMLSNFAAVGSTVTETTVAGGTTDNYVLNIVDNATCDGSETFVFTITNVTGGQGTPAIGTQSTYTLIIADDEQTSGAVQTISFEGSDNWGFTGTGATSSTANKFFGTTSYEIDGGGNLTTNNFSIAGLTNVTLQVAFAATGADSGDDLFLDISYDNGATWAGTGSVKLMDGFSNANLNMGNTNVSNPTTVASNPWTVNIPSSETQIRVRLRSTANNTGDIYFVDDIILFADFCGCTPPTTQPTSINFTTVNSTDMTINWVGGNGSNSLVVVHEGSAVTATPGNIAYTANTIFASGSDLGGNDYVVYNGTGNTVTVTGLTPNTVYHVSIFEFDTGPECYNTTAPTTGNQTTACAAIPDPVSGLGVVVGNMQATVSWTNPIGCFDEVLVVAEPGNIGFSPTGDGTAYTANSVYGTGTCVNCTGTNTEYAVYKGVGTSVTVTGLTNGDSYCFKVWTRLGTTWSVQAVDCGNIPVADIPDNGCSTSNYLTSTFTYAGTGPIADIDVSVFIEHTFRGDLVIDVISPTGTIVTILNSQGGTANNLEATFDDASANVTYTTTHTLNATIDETFQPNGGTLSTFNTENPNGVWTLRICDDAGADTGGLINWFPTITESCIATHTVTGLTPTTGPELTMVTITGTGFTNASTASIGGVATTTTFINATTLQVEIPVGASTNTITITESGCPISSAGSFTVIENLGGCTGATAFTDLIISEVYDSDANNVWYIELFNPTGTAIDLGAENYTIDRYADAWFSGVSRTITLTGVVAAGSTFLVNIGSSTNSCAGTWDFTESGGGINESDGIMLVKNGTDVDAVICPNQTGYSILRDPNAIGPTSTYAAGDWTTDLTEDCADLGNFVLPTPPPTVNTDPIDVFACAQAMTTAATAGNGGTLTYQWLYNDGSAAGWSNVTGAAFPTLTVAGETTVNLSITGTPTDIATIDNYQFYCEVTEDGTCSAPSKAAQFYARTEDDPQLITAMINSCDADCGTEGENEYVILSLGDAAVSVSPANIALSYGTTIGTVVTHTDTYTADVALVSALNAQNAANGCGSAVFVDAVTTGTLPASSKVIIMDPNICITAYDFSNFCGSGPIYLLFSTDATWGPGGNFSNNTVGDRFFTLSVTDVNGQTVYSEYSYDGSNFANQDGEFAQFSFCEGAATQYGDDGCNIKAATLPAELINFDAKRNDKVVDLNWATASEINVDQHVIQRSSDGEQFYDILSVTATGNSSTNTYYTDVDYNPLDGVSYYRLKTVDFDDTFELSPARIVNFESNDPVVLYGHNEWIISYKTEQPFYYELYNVLGEVLNNDNVAESGNTRTSINHASLPNGVYFINVTSGDYKKSIKVIK